MQGMIRGYSQIWSSGCRWTGLHVNLGMDTKDEAERAMALWKGKQVGRMVLAGGVCHCTGNLGFTRLVQCLWFNSARSNTSAKDSFLPAFAELAQVVLATAEALPGATYVVHHNFSICYIPYIYIDINILLLTITPLSTLSYQQCSWEVIHLSKLNL